MARYSVRLETGGVLGIDVTTGLLPCSDCDEYGKALRDHTHTYVQPVAYRYTRQMLDGEPEALTPKQAIEIWLSQSDTWQREREHLERFLG